MRRSSSLSSTLSTPRSQKPQSSLRVSSRRQSLVPISQQQQRRQQSSLLPSTSLLTWIVAVATIVGLIFYLRNSESFTNESSSSSLPSSQSSKNRCVLLRFASSQNVPVIESLHHTRTDVTNRRPSTVSIEAMASCVDEGDILIIALPTTNVDDNDNNDDDVVATAIRNLQHHQRQFGYAIRKSNGEISCLILRKCTRACNFLELYENRTTDGRLLTSMMIGDDTKGLSVI
jgi:hypothetical protein